MPYSEETKREDGQPHAESFSRRRVPPYACPTCKDGVLLLLSETLCAKETAESRRIHEAAGPEIGGGQWRFACLFRCSDPDCSEIVSAAGLMRWASDPRCVPEGKVALWRPEFGPLPDHQTQLQREQARLMRLYQPLVFLPPLPLRGTSNQPAALRHAADFSWIQVQGVHFALKSGLQARIIRVLWEAWKASGGHDGAGLAEATVKDAVGSSADRFRIRKIFQGHAILDSVLRSVSQGQWAIFLNEGSKPSSS